MEMLTQPRRHTLCTDGTEELGPQRRCQSGVGLLGAKDFLEDGRRVASAPDGVQRFADDAAHEKINSSFFDGSKDVRYDFRFVAEPLLGWTRTDPSRDENCAP
jgi:hypothetical protein